MCYDSCKVFSVDRPVEGARLFMGFAPKFLDSLATFPRSIMLVRYSEHILMLDISVSYW